MWQKPLTLLALIRLGTRLVLVPVGQLHCRDELNYTHSVAYQMLVVSVRHE
jgi:hypothetical protein